MTLKTLLGWGLGCALALAACSSSEGSNDRTGAAHPMADAALDGPFSPGREPAEQDSGEREAQSRGPTDLDAAGCTPVDARGPLNIIGTVTDGRETLYCDTAPRAPIDKTCARDEDCVVVAHRYDHCGGSGGPAFAYVGIAIGDRPRFDADEAACQWPPTACSGQFTMAEDGTRPASGDAQARVSCCGGLCRATFSP